MIDRTCGIYAEGYLAVAMEKVEGAHLMEIDTVGTCLYIIIAVVWAVKRNVQC